ncbi:MAG: nitrilase-related carbon-nitrogen hydrolase [Fimbriimonas sp.]
MKAILAAILTAVLLVLSLPPVGWWPLAWIALVPAFWASSGQGFLRGFLIAIGASLLLGWFAVNGLLYSEKSFEGATSWTYLSTAMFGFVVSMCCGILGEMKQFTWRGVVGLAAMAVLLDFLLMPILPVTFAISQSRVSGMLMLSSWTGIWGVSFALWGVNLGIARSLGSRQFKKLVPVLAPIALLLVIGALPIAGRKGRMSEVAVVQSESSDLDEMELLSRKDVPDLAVWPEFAGLAHVQEGDASTLIALAKKPGMPAIVTSFPDGNKPLPRNTAALFNAAGESARYYKRRLFGGEKNMHIPGMEAAVALTEWGPVGLNICFDSCFPSLMRDSARLGEVGLIALPTIDPESPHGFLAAMHAAFTPFRAAELGVAIARADGHAHSMIVTNTGEILLDLPPGLQDSAAAKIDITPRWTLYKALGDWFLYLCGVGLVVLLLERGRPRPGNSQVQTNQSAIIEP